MQKEEDTSYQIYTSDLLKGIFERLGGEVARRFGDYLTDRYTPEETRTAEEIIKNIKDKMNELSEVKK